MNQKWGFNYILGDGPHMINMNKRAKKFIEHKKIGLYEKMMNAYNIHD